MVALIVIATGWPLGVFILYQIDKATGWVIADAFGKDKPDDKP